MSSPRRIAAVARVELARLLRTRMTFTLLLLVPALQVVLFGTAIRPQAARITVAIAAPSPQSATSVAADLARQPGLALVGGTLRPGEAEAMVRGGKALIGIEIPATRSFANPTVPLLPVRVIVDASNPALTTVAAPRIEAAYWRALAIRAEVETTGPGLRIERLYNPEERADWAFLPALAGVTVMIAMIMLGSLSLARERETGTWETLLSLPIGKGEALAGRLLPYTAIGTVQGVLVLAAGWLIFDMPMRGSAAALVALLPLFAAAHFAIGYAISARAATQLAALQGAVAFYLPAMLLSGFLYPFETLPPWAQAIGNGFPLTHFIDAARGAMLRGDSAASVLASGIPIVVALCLATVVALIAQGRRLD